MDFTMKIWKTSIVELFNEEIRDTVVRTTLGANSKDLSSYGLVSIRIKNTLDTAVHIQLYTDIDTTSDTTMCNSTGELYTIDLQPVATAGVRCVTITSDTWDILDFIMNVKLRIEVDTLPTVGDLKIWACGKR